MLILAGQCNAWDETYVAQFILPTVHCNYKMVRALLRPSVHDSALHCGRVYQFILNVTQGAQKFMDGLTANRFQRCLQPNGNTLTIVPLFRLGFCEVRGSLSYLSENFPNSLVQIDGIIVGLLKGLWK